MRTLTFVSACLFAATLSADPESVKLEWKLSKGDRIEFKVDSLIDFGGRKEARFEGSILIDEADGTGKAQGVMSFKALSASKALSGNGAKATESQLANKAFKCRMTANGRVFVDTEALGRLQKELEDPLEDISLISHFTELFFELPEKKLGKGSQWKVFQNNTTFELTLAEFRKNDAGQLMAVITGKPVAIDSKDEVRGSVEIEFDLDRGFMTSYKQDFTRKRTSGDIITTTETTSAKRSITISRSTAKTEMVSCPNCGTQYEKGSFCPKDGKPLEPVAEPLRCAKCTKRYRADVKFCPDDGAKLEPVPTETAPTCPQCQQAFPKETRFCPKDGTKLEEKAVRKD